MRWGPLASAERALAPASGRWEYTQATTDQPPMPLRTPPSRSVRYTHHMRRRPMPYAANALGGSPRYARYKVRPAEVWDMPV